MTTTTKKDTDKNKEDKDKVVSFSDKLQAQNDLFANTGLTEDSLGNVILDVMANDIGGKEKDGGKKEKDGDKKVKGLWSLDDGVSANVDDHKGEHKKDDGRSHDSHSADTEDIRPLDLLTHDTARTEALTSDRSANGAKIWITADGKVGYDAATLSDAFKAQLQGLNVGGYLTDTFTYAIQLNNGKISWATATVRIDGVNDPAILSPATVALTETDAAADISTSGTLTITDVDSDNTFNAVTTTGAYGVFVIDATGAWTYTASSAHDEFVAGITYSDIFPVTSADGTATSVTVNILGTNDGAILSADVKDLTETDAAAAADISTSGTLTITDVDSDNTFNAVTITGAYGVFVIDAAGAWTYTASSAHDEFVAGITYSDIFPVTSADSTATSVTVNILGTNDAAILSSAVVELDETNAALSTGGLLTISDVDSANTFDVQTANVGAYGVFAIDATGAWTYLANSAFDSLNVGDSVSDTFTVDAADGTQTSVQVTINGTNDGPIAVNDSGTVSEDGPGIILNLLSNDSDIELNPLSILSLDTTGLHGAVTDNHDGTVTYNPNGAFESLNDGDTATDIFSYTITDGHGGTSTAAVNIGINGVTDVVIASKIDFEDRGNGEPIPDGYHGFNWHVPFHNNLYTLNGTTYGSSGYQNAGTGYVAFTPGASQPVTITHTDGSDFTFTDVQLTSAWDSSQTATLQGYNNGVLIGSDTVTIYQSHHIDVHENWGAIDQLVIGNNGSHLVLDNFVM